MARKIRGLYQPTYTKALPDGTRETRRSEGWWLQYYVNGKRYRVNLADHAGGDPVKDKRVAERLAGKILAASDEKKANLEDPVETAGRRPLEDHFKDFETWLKGRGVGTAHVKDRMRYLRDFAVATGAGWLRDLDGTKATDWLGKLRDGEEHLGARSLNIRRAALRQFARWCLDERRLAFDPFRRVPHFNEDVDRRRPRRALAPNEFSALIEATRRRPLEDATRPRKIRSKTGVAPKLKDDEKARLVALGETRALLYEVAAGTGLRKSELEGTTWGNVDLLRARVNVPAKTAKSKRDQFVDLRSDLVAALKAFKPKDPKPTDAVFPPSIFSNLLRTFRDDLNAAGIKWRREDDPEGRQVDFHSLRVTLGSNLAAAGVHPAVARTIMRHSSIELTMSFYTDVRVLDTRGALEKLAPSKPVEAADRKSG